MQAHDFNRLCCEWARACNQIRREHFQENSLTQEKFKEICKSIGLQVRPVPTVLCDVVLEHSTHP